MYLEPVTIATLPVRSSRSVSGLILPIVRKREEKREKEGVREKTQRGS